MQLFMITSKNTGQLNNIKLYYIITSKQTGQVSSDGTAANSVVVNLGYFPLRCLSYIAISTILTTGSDRAMTSFATKRNKNILFPSLAATNTQQFNTNRHNILNKSRHNFLCDEEDESEDDDEEESS